MPLYSSPYAKLEMTSPEKEQLHAIAMDLVGQGQLQYERYVWEDCCVLDPQRWKQVRECEDLRVYLDTQPREAAVGNKVIHGLLQVGSVVGTLGDAMFGELAPTTDAMRVRTAYTGDTLIDCAVLETIVEPTVDQPFQSMSVRWFVKAVPLHIRLMTKHIDNVLLEATGTKLLHNGEQIGYRLMHSISSPKTPKLPQYERDNLSICAIWRQVAPQRVQLYMVTYTEMMQPAFVVPMAIKSVAEAMLSVHKVIECARLKKLASLVQSKALREQREPSSDARFDRGDCSVCGTVTPRCPRQRATHVACAACLKTACSACCSKRTIYMVSPDGQLGKLKMRFCLTCVASAALLDAARVAQEELMHGHQKRSGLSLRALRAMTLSSSEEQHSEVRSQPVTSS